MAMSGHGDVFDPDSGDSFEEYMEWWSQPMMEHECQGCGLIFRAQASRGPLGYCDGCADRREQGMEL